MMPGTALPLVRTIQAAPDPLALYAALTDGGRRADTLLLESGDTSTRYGERSLLVVGAALRLTCRGKRVEVVALSPHARGLLGGLAARLEGLGTLQQADGVLSAEFSAPPAGSLEERLLAPSPLDVPRQLLQGLAASPGGADDLPLLVGSFGYDLIDAFETLPRSAAPGTGWPDFELWLPERAIWLDHCHVTATVRVHAFASPDFDAAYSDAMVAMAELSAAVGRTPPPTRDPPRPLRRPGFSRHLAVTVDRSDEEYAATVGVCQRHIVVGDVFQIVPSRTFSVPCAEPLAAYARLRRLNPSPYMFFLRGSAGCLFGASPETAVKVDGTPRTVSIRPIAGTRPRARREDGTLDADRDSRLEVELRSDEKERAEHLMLVDLARNDVARVSVAGTRAVTRLLEVDRYSHVMHLVSHVVGTLRPGLDALHAYVAAANAGTLVGAPKLMAASLLRRTEATARGAYGGAVGFVTADFRLDTALCIRSAVVVDGVATVRAGAGVVYDSVPLAEAQETRIKAEAVLQAILDTGLATGGVGEER